MLASPGGTTMRYTIRDLRRMWKPHKERLNGSAKDHATNIRFHRSCSWLQRAESALESDDLDVALLSQWVAFNALYGQWDDVKREPLPDQQSWRAFLGRIIELDRERFIGKTLEANRGLVMSVFRNKFLSRNFWQAPSEIGDPKTAKIVRCAQTWYRDRHWRRILYSLLERIYFLRCQLVHGAATYESKLNRTALKYCSLSMDQMVRSFLYVLIQDGADEDWGRMCYPPIWNDPKSR